jgi:hypothetical protein
VEYKQLPSNPRLRSRQICSNISSHGFCFSWVCERSGVALGFLRPVTNFLTGFQNHWIWSGTACSAHIGSVCRHTILPFIAFAPTRAACSGFADRRECPPLFAESLRQRADERRGSAQNAAERRRVGSAEAGRTQSSCGGEAQQMRYQQQKTSFVWLIFLLFSPRSSGVWRQSTSIEYEASVRQTLMQGVNRINRSRYPDLGVSIHKLIRFHA